MDKKSNRTILCSIIQIIIKKVIYMKKNNNEDIIQIDEVIGKENIPEKNKER